MNIDPVLLPGLLITGLALFGYILIKSVKNPFIAFFLVLFTEIWIFAGHKILAPIGLNFKPHAIVFLLVTLLSVYFIVKNFNYLWSYKPFRYLFVFFVVSSIYALFYKTDFRSSSYIDLWIHNNLGLKHSAIGAGHGSVTRQFGSAETQYLVYLAGLAPMVGFLAGFMSLKGSLVKLQNIITLFSFGVLGYFILLATSIFLLDSTTVMFVQGRLAFDGNFAGGEVDGLFLILLIGFLLYILENKDFKHYNLTKWTLITNIMLYSILILLGIKKGTIISLFIAAHVPIYLVLAVKLWYREKLDLKFNPVMALIPLFIVLPMLFAPEFFETTVDNISKRFSSNSTLDVRMVNWELYNQHWLANLDFFKALFGFGIDSSREATFFLTAMHPDPSFQQPHIHNIYLEMFYNYGLMAFLFFLPLILVFFSNLMPVLRNKYNLTHMISMTLIIYFLIFYITESPSIPSIITFFSVIGFLEAIRRKGFEREKENPVFN